MKPSEYPITVTKPFLPNKAAFDKLTDEIWKNRWLTNDGPLLQKFTQVLKNYTGATNVSTTVNGHMGLDIAIKAEKLKGEIITTPFSFASTTHAIVMNGCKPVFCDIKEDDYTIDTNQIEDLITDDTTAIMPVHVYGYPCDVEKIDKIAKKYGLKIIYDAAHAFGVKYHGKSLVNYGDISMVSFHATKLFNTIEGGALFYEDSTLSTRINAYKNFGIINETNIDYIGGNAKMNEFQAAMGLLNMQSINSIIADRKRITECYRNLLDDIEGISFHMTEDSADFEYNYAYFPIIIDEKVFGKSREYIYNKLKDWNVFTRRYFYPLISDYACYKSLPHKKLPIAKHISDSVLCLPMYNGLTETDIHLVVDAITSLR